MPEYSFPAPPAAVVRIGETVLAHAADYTVKAAQACFPVECFGSGCADAVVPGSLRYTVQLTRLLWEESAVDFYTLSNFSVDITRCGKKITFSGCQWTAITEEYGDALLWEKATLTAAARTEAAV